MSKATNELDLIVVGAGPSGLAYGLGAQAAAEASGRELRLAVLEAADRVGGWVHTRREGRYLLETGPYGYMDKHPELGSILSRLGLAERALAPAPVARNRYVFVRGKLRRMPSGPVSFVFSRILRPRAKLRLLREPWASPHPGPGVDETVTDFARRRLGPEAAEALVVPMFTGIYAGDPDRASLASCFPRMAELEAEHGGLFRALWRLRKKVKRSGQGVGAPRGQLTSFPEGLSTLMEALSAKLGDALRLGSRVTRVERQGEGFLVRIGSEEVLSAARVVLAAPARRLVDVVRGMDPKLAEILGSVKYGGVSVVHTAYSRQDTQRVPEGFGFLVPRQARRELLGSVFVSTIFPGQAPADELLLRNVLGGVLQPELVEASEDRLREIVAREHREILGIDAPPLFCEVERFPGSLPQYEVGHGELLGRLERRLGRYPGLHVTGNAWRGIGLADCLAKNYAAAREHFGGKG